MKLTQNLLQPTRRLVALLIGLGGVTALCAEARVAGRPAFPAPGI